MKSATFGEAGDIVVADAKIPEPRPGWVRLATAAVGICGTERPN